jgi:hypothetical protein
VSAECDPATNITTKSLDVAVGDIFTIVGVNFPFNAVTLTLDLNKINGNHVIGSISNSPFGLSSIRE